MPFNELTGALGVHRAAHLLRRTTFGATKEQIDFFASLTPQQAINILFNSTLPDPELPIDLETGTEWVESGKTGANSGERELIAFLKAWMLGQMMGANITDSNLKLAYSAREKIVFFLHTHFTTIEEKVNDSRALYYQNQLFRLFALDKEDDTVEIEDEETGDMVLEDAPRNFKELTKKICVDNAMLIFLDGTLNVKGSPNENYAREMFELYTVGRGLEVVVNNMEPDDAGDYFTFKEQDVQAAARVLTGFAFDNQFSIIDPYTGLPRGRMNSGSHTTNSDEKDFSEYYDNTIIQQDNTITSEEERMLDEVSQMIDMIYENEETPKNICRKLYRFFVYYNITEEIDNTVIADMADIFVNNEYRIQPVLEALFTSQFFYEASTDVADDKFGGIIKSPLDLVLGTHVFFGTEVPDYLSDTKNYYNFMQKRLISKLSLHGMNFYNPYEVAGYGAYHQYPVFNRNWISTNYLTYRYEFIRVIFEGEGTDMDDDYILPPVDILQYVKDNFMAEAQDAKDFIKAMAPYFLPVAQNLDFDTDMAGRGMTKERLRYFLQAFLQFMDYNDTAEVNDKNAIWVSLLNDPAQYLLAGDYLRRLFNAMLQTPEYQLF
ncbi:DUF1800 family protein [Fulvivirga ligni]|uniref:DUF1800 family protein n=1 Tax=Fulvivirga ligni TaxID=2904246 RepID=UPI001F1D49A0|nr:DUF1800 family protein [Fulvivirga ligni]UII19299.1 DUF1800 domain-containing protein [Fulvivirga ligni]